MLLQLALTLISAVFGLVAGVCFCVGSAFSSINSIADLCESAWGYSSVQAKAQESQSTQYLIGSLFLLGAFVLQVIAAIANATTKISLPAMLTTPIPLLISTLILASLLALIGIRIFSCYRQPKLLAELKRRHPS